MKCLFTDDINEIIATAVEMLEFRLKRELTDEEYSELESKIFDSMKDYDLGDYSNYN